MFLQFFFSFSSDSVQVMCVEFSEEEATKKLIHRMEFSISSLFLQILSKLYVMNYHQKKKPHKTSYTGCH